MALLLNRGTPGYELFVDSAGPQIPVVAVYSRCYLLATTTGTVVPPLQFTAVGSMDDFKNLFGSSDALILNSVENYLENFDQGLYIARIVPSAIATVTITTLTASATYTITINGTAIPFVLDGTPTLAEATLAAITAINNTEAVNLAVEAEPNLNTDGTPNYTTGVFRLRSKNNSTFTATATPAGSVTVSAVTTPTTPQFWDWIAAFKEIARNYDDEALGFLCAPQAFYNTLNQFERTQIGNAMAEYARALRWMALLDPHRPDIIDHPRKAKADGITYIAPQGHSYYSYPYFLDRDSDYVATSTAIASAGVRRYFEQGIQEPPCGPRCVLNGISGVAYKLDKAQKIDLAEAGININIFERGRGAMPYDDITRSTNPAFQAINAVVVLNSFVETAERTFRVSDLIHTSVDSRGKYYLQVQLLLTGVCQLFYAAGCLYGIRPGEAYRVECNADLQNAINLEQRIVQAKVHLVPVPTARRLRIYIYRVAIDQMDQSIAIVGGSTRTLAAA
jgi:hypothetical protein